MRILNFTTQAAILLAHAPLAWAVDASMTPGGYTGLSLTPNAHTLAWGRFETTYDNQLPGVVRQPKGHNFIAAFGLLPNLEVSGRAAANDLHNNCFTQGCGTARDLSAAAKLGIGLDAGNRFRAAVGATDFGGAATFFRSYYGVLTYNEGPFEASAGWARRSTDRPTVSKSPLNGPFASAAWQPLPWVRGHLEMTDRNAWAGVRLFAPPEWLPEGWVASVGANQRLTNNALTGKSWWSMGLSIPLYKVPDLRTTSGGASASTTKAPLPTLALGQFPDPSYEARILPLPTPPVVAATGNALPILDSHLNELAAELRAKGLEDISVGRMPDGSIAIAANNTAYKWNSLDALGAAIGAVSRTLGFAKSGYRLVLTQRQIPLVAVTGQTDCLRQWINNDNQTCTAGQLSTPGSGGPLEALHTGATWVVQGSQPSYKTLRLGIAPILRTNITTELGVLDGSLGVNISLVQPLWGGASVEWSRNVPLAESDDYLAQGVFGSRRVRPTTERFALTQTVRVPLERWLAQSDDALANRWGLGAVTAQATVGRVGSFYNGAHGAIRWEPGQGTHRVTAQAGAFKNTEFNNFSGNLPLLRTAKPMLVSYRYAFMPTRSYAEATAGQFMNNDRGFQFGLRQWFSDVAVNAYFRRTSFNENQRRNFVGLEVSVPIGLRRDSTPLPFLQVGGTQRFAHAVELLIDNPNSVSPGYGVAPPVPTIDAAFNSDRASLVYFEDNMRRIRDSAR